MSEQEENQHTTEGRIQLLNRCFASYFTRKEFTASEFVSSLAKSAYEKSKWIKVTFDKQTKRFPNPPKDLDQFVDYARTRFSVLDKVLETGNFKSVVSCQPGGGIGCCKIPFTALENSVDFVRALYMSLGSG